MTSDCPLLSLTLIAQAFCPVGRWTHRQTHRSHRRHWLPYPFVLCCIFKCWYILHDIRPTIGDQLWWVHLADSSSCCEVFSFMHLLIANKFSLCLPTHPPPPASVTKNCAVKQYLPHRVSCPWVGSTHGLAWVGLDWIWLDQDFFKKNFGGLDWVLDQNVTFRLSATQLPTPGFDFLTESGNNWTYLLWIADLHCVSLVIDCYDPEHIKTALHCALLTVHCCDAYVYVT